MIYIRFTVLAFALMILPGCSLLPAILNACECEEMPAAPAKPRLPSVKATEDGGIQFDKQDAGRLGEYILKLERGYK